MLSLDLPTTFSAARDLSAATLLSTARPALHRQLGSLAVGDFRLHQAKDTATATGARLAHVMLQQMVNGVPVHGSYLNFTMRKGDARAPARIVATSFRLFHQARVNTTADLSGDAGLDRARARLGASRNDAVGSQELELRNLGGQLQLVWSIVLTGTHSRALVYANGPYRGRVQVIDERIYEADGVVRGSHVQGGAPGGAGIPVTQGLADVDVVGGSAAAVTNPLGEFTLDVADGEPVEARLSGSATMVVDALGGDLSDVQPAAAGMELLLGAEDAAEQTLAQTTAYVFATRAHDYLIDNGVTDHEPFGAITTNVNLPETCNAYYSPPELTINFFASGGGCNNSAIDSVIVHEYGHFVDDAAGGIYDGGLSEGWGDTLACYVLGSPEMGTDLFPGEPGFRSCENDYIYPPDGYDEVHELGQAWAGFTWLVRQGLIEELGEVDGDALARALVLPSLSSNAPDIPSAVREVFLRDDDDGDLTNETPHWAVLSAAAAHHGLLFALNTDDTPPSPVSDLEAVNVTATSVMLQWTAPGDDGDEGTAAYYDLRYAMAPITADNFLGAYPVAAPTPTEAGTLQIAKVAVPPESTVYVALVAYDEQLNQSGLSNLVTATTPEGVTIFSEDFEGDAAGWSLEGLWHVSTRRAAEGLQASWYGQEATGNYDTGAANYGILWSPILDLTDAPDPVLVFDEFIDVEPGDYYDLLEVYIFDPDNSDDVVVLSKTNFTTDGQFRWRSASLDQFADGLVQIAFVFDTIDEYANEYEGWFIDNVRIVTSEPGNSCAHPLCEGGVALDPECEPCVATVCELDSFCCEVEWDGICVDEAQEMCGLTCPVCGDSVCEAGEDCASCPADCGECGSTCEHDVCEPGTPLESDCDSCVSQVCAADDFCCETLWDRICVQEAEETCGVVCQGCAHNLCDVGEAVEASCDPCAETVCAADDYCCANAWDTRCVAEATELCALECPTCLHDPCIAGEELAASCDPCVEAVCITDPYCCESGWDDRCIEQSQELCGLICEGVR